MVEESVSQEHLIPQVAQAMKAVLVEAAERLARPSGLIKRQVKVTGPLLLQTLVFGWMADPSAGMDVLARTAREVGLSISASGLEQRMNRDTACFLRHIFEVALAQVVLADPVAIGLLSRFAGVCLEDSTTISLPPELQDVFAGNGGKASPAACKLFARLDMLTGQLTCSPLVDGRTADTRTPLAQHPTPARTLQIRDKGFTDLTRWKQEEEQGQFVLSYLRSDVVVFDEQGVALDLLTWLPSAGASGEKRVLLGHQRLPMRLFYERVPEEVARERKKKVRRETKERGLVLSARVMRLAEWSIAVTSVPADLLTWSEALVLLRLRWQIELLFKLWKERGLLDEWRTLKSDRMLCEIYAKLIGLLIQHWLLIISCWQEPLRSLVKAAKAIRSQVALLTAALDGDWDLSHAIARIQKLALAGARQNQRADAPSTAQLLLKGANQWSSKPLTSWRPYRRKTPAWAKNNLSSS